MAETQETNVRNKKLNNGAMPLSDIFFMTLRHWPWILLSVVVCVGLAYFYVLRTPSVYTRQAEILIKDEDNQEDYANLGLFENKSNIQNEMTNLKAQDLMEEVVRRLHLDVNYYTQGKFHDQVAYGTTLPVRVDFSKLPEEAGISFDLEVAPGGKVTIEDIEIPVDNVLRDGGDNPCEGKEYTGMLNDSIATPVGKFVVVPTNTYNKNDKVQLIVKKFPIHAARDSYENRLVVSRTNDKGSVIKLTMADQSQQRADDVLSMLIGVYNENWVRDKNQIAVSTSNFINERLGVIENELGSVDSDISTYKSQHLVPNVEAAASMYMSQNAQNEAAILEVNNQLQMARYIRSYLTAAGNRDQLLPTNSGINSANISSQIASYNDQILTRNSLIAKSSEKNPLVSQIDEQLDAQRKVIIQTVDNEIVALNSRLKMLYGNEATTQARLASNPTQAKNLLSVERQQKVKESLYLFLLQKREENELSQAFSAYNTRIVNKPGAAPVPPTPNKRNILAIAFLVGLALPFGVTYVVETTNTKVRGRKDVENLTLPFLGEIPMVGGRKKDSRFDFINKLTGKKIDSGDEEEKKVVVKEGKRDVINESFRVLRTNIEFMKGADHSGCNVIAITSFNPHSGKSFISINAGKALSLKRKRVLVIDGDMRHGTASAYVGSPENGLADYLNGKITDVDTLIVPVDESNYFSILPVGTIPPNPAELLETDTFAEMIDHLRGEYDYVIIDCPPIEVVADAQIIDRVADRTFFILRAGLLERGMLDELEKLYDSKKYRNMAFILNGTAANQGKYGYSHGYRYGYGYGYAYGYAYGPDKPKSKKSK